MNNFIEIYADNDILDFERKVLAEVNIPSLLPVNIINKNENNSVCFITSGYKTIANMEITDIQSLCHIVKSFVKAIITSEQYLLQGGKHFIDTDMVFYNTASGEIKLVFGKINDRGCCYGDIDVIIDFIENMKKSVDDKIYIHILEQIIIAIKRHNTDIKRIEVLIEEIERKWYCRNLIPEVPFSQKRNDNKIH